MMNKSQFQFQRFWRLLRVKFAEEASLISRIILVGILILLVIRIGHMVFSSGNYLGAFIKDAEIIHKIPGYTFLTAYFVSLMAIVKNKNIISYFLCPATNLERYVVLHALAFVFFFLATILIIFVVEGLWRLGLWFLFPDIYSQYLQAMAEYSHKPIYGLFILLLLAVFYIMYVVISKTLQKYGIIKGAIVFSGIAAVYLILSFVAAFGIAMQFQKDMKEFFLVIINLPALIYLLIATYRCFCHYEPNFQKLQMNKEL